VVRRFWEIDALRGLAVVAMIAFHTVFDLHYFAGISLLPGDAWFWLPRAIGAAFIFLAGVSLTLSKSTPFKRGAMIFSWGLAITAVTWFAFPINTIWFGVLHLIGLSIILAPFLERGGPALAAALIAIGAWLQFQSFQFPWLLWLGFAPAQFYSFDYYPLLPWLGVLLLGMWAGRKLYSKAKPRVAPALVSPLCFLGRNSLAIYLLHQPLLVLAVTLLT